MEGGGQHLWTSILEASLILYAEEDLCRRDTDIFAVLDKSVLDVNLYYGWRLKVSCQAKGSDRFPKGIVSNRRMHVRYMGVTRCGALGKYYQIW